MNESQTNSYDEECFKEMDERHKNKIDDAQTSLETLHNEKGPSPESMLDVVNATTTTVITES